MYFECSLGKGKHFLKGQTDVRGRLVGISIVEEVCMETVSVSDKQAIMVRNIHFCADKYNEALKEALENGVNVIVNGNPNQPIHPTCTISEGEGI